MKRRDLLRYLLAAPIAATLDVEKLLWVPGEKAIFIPSARQLRFMEFDRLMLYGIPYHLFDSTTGTWLGLKR